MSKLPLLVKCACFWKIWCQKVSKLYRFWVIEPRTTTGKPSVQWWILTKIILTKPKHQPCRSINRTKASTAPKHRPHRSIDRTETSTTPKDRPCRNIDHAETSTTPKHRPRQSIYHAEASTAPEHQPCPYMKTAFWKKVWKKSKEIKPNLILLWKMHITIKIWLFKKNGTPPTKYI